MKILGEQAGVKLIPRGKDDNHILIQLLAEDDENWHETDYIFSSYWLDDLIKVLELTKTHLNNNTNKSQCGFGNEFKKE